MDGLPLHDAARLRLHQGHSLRPCRPTVRAGGWKGREGGYHACCSAAACNAVLQQGVSCCNASAVSAVHAEPSPWQRRAWLSKPGTVDMQNRTAMIARCMLQAVRGMLHGQPVDSSIAVGCTARTSTCPCCSLSSWLRPSSSQSASYSGRCRFPSHAHTHATWATASLSIDVARIRTVARRPLRTCCTDNNRPIPTASHTQCSRVLRAVVAGGLAVLGGACFVVPKGQGSPRRYSMVRCVRWHVYLILTNQTTIEFYSNRFSA